LKASATGAAGFGGAEEREAVVGCGLSRGFFSSGENQAEEAQDRNGSEPPRQRMR
jgi:hypothetical protein